MKNKTADVKGEASEEKSTEKNGSASEKKLSTITASKKPGQKGGSGKKSSSKK